MKRQKSTASGMESDRINYRKITVKNSFKLDAAIEKWTRQFMHCSTLEDGDIAELKSHLQDEIDEFIAEGENPRDAFHAAVASVEKIDLIGREYHKTAARGVLTACPFPGTGFSPALILNSLKISFRKMRRRKWYALISIAGLAAGLACSILILLWIQDELSFDRFHAHASHIYRVIMEDPFNDGISVHPWLPYPLGPALNDNFPEVEAVTRWRPDSMVVRTRVAGFGLCFPDSYTAMDIHPDGLSGFAGGHRVGGLPVVSCRLCRSRCQSEI